MATAKNKDGNDTTTVDEPSILDGFAPDPQQQPEGGVVPAQPEPRTYNAPVTEVSNQPAHLLWYEGKPERESHLYQEVTMTDAGGNLGTYGVIENEYDDGTVEVRTPLGLSQRLPLVLDEKAGDAPRGHSVYLGQQEIAPPEPKKEEVKEDAGTDSN